MFLFSLLLGCKEPTKTGVSLSDITEGELVITEIMHDSTASWKGEWFEVYN